MPKIDLTGQRFGKLTVQSFAEYRNHESYWLCKCDCGNESIVYQYNLRSGKIVSCGCSKRGIAHYTRHNMSQSRLYSIWNSMKNRCNNPKKDNYNCYGGRGIKVCDKWLKFEGFLEDMQEGYDEHLTLDRIDSNGNYEKSNCRWSTIKNQQNNRRSNVYLKKDGIIKTATEWAEEMGIDANILRIVFNNSEYLSMFERV